MSEAYRQKLLNWFCSMMLSLLVGALNACIYWFYKFPEHVYFTGDPNIFRLAGALGEAFLISAIYMAIFIVWHFLDFVDKSLADTPWLRRLAGYGFFCRTVGFTMLVFLVMVTGIFDYNSCDDLDGAFYFQCVVGPPWWLIYPWFAGLGLALLLCIAKGVIAIKSRLMKAP